MNRVLPIATTIMILLLCKGKAMAIEEADYTVIKKSDAFELRDYAAHILAETVVEASLEDAGNEAFRLLFKYISGNNTSSQKVPMTAPVTQQPVGQKIKMTAPVGQQQAENGGWLVSFTMPRAYTMETIPQPTNPKVTLRHVPAQRMATIRYSGFWSEERYLKHKKKLESWIHDLNLTCVGDPIWARYNPPFTPWFLRRNEILIPVATEQENQTLAK
jgi:hypothetical protein